MIDFEKFEQQFGMTKEDFLMFLDEFEERLIGDIPQLKSLLVNHNFAELASATHKLKTPAATLGLTDLHGLLVGIESSAKSESDIDLLNEQMHKLEQQFVLFQSEFEHFKNA